MLLRNVFSEVLTDLSTEASNYLTSLPVTTTGFQEKILFRFLHSQDDRFQKQTTLNVAEREKVKQCYLLN